MNEIEKLRKMATVSEEGITIFKGAYVYCFHDDMLRVYEGNIIMSRQGSTNAYVHDDYSPGKIKGKCFTCHPIEGLVYSHKTLWLKERDLKKACALFNEHYKRVIASYECKCKMLDEWMTTEWTTTEKKESSGIVVLCDPAKITHSFMTKNKGGMFMSKLTEDIKKFLSMRNMDRQTFAKKAGVDPRALSRFLNSEGTWKLSEENTVRLIISIEKDISDYGFEGYLYTIDAEEDYEKWSIEELDELIVKLMQIRMDKMKK